MWTDRHQTGLHPGLSRSGKGWFLSTFPPLLISTPLAEQQG